MRGLKWIVPSLFRETFALFPSLTFKPRDSKVFYNFLGSFEFWTIFPLKNEIFFLCSIFWRNIVKVLHSSLPVSKPDFLLLEYSLFLFCIAEIISESNQGLELALTLTFLIGATELITVMNLFVKSKYTTFM